MKKLVLSDQLYERKIDIAAIDANDYRATNGKKNI